MEPMEIMPVSPGKRRPNRRQYLFASTAAASVLFIIVLFIFNPSLPAKAKEVLHIGAGETADSKDESMYNPKKWWFQDDLEGFPLPTFNASKLRNYPPHNYRGAGQKAFATFFMTRNGTTKDPYFIASQQFVYRMLWDPVKKSAKHPVIVFVPDFVPDEQRQYFAAAGAIVREVNLREFDPESKGLPERLQDMFTKLEMWRQTDFDRIFYVDSDAVPYTNLDAIFDFPEQRCVKDKLPAKDVARIASICDYVFAAWPESVGGQLNAGVMLLKPNRPMYRRLVRDSKSHTGWNEATLEQGFLDHEFHADGAFPARHLAHEWNGAVDMRDRNEDFHIVHTKVWALTSGPYAWASADFNKTWADMTKLYNSDEFVRLREKDRELAFAESEKHAKEDGAKEPPPPEPPEETKASG